MKELKLLLLLQLVFIFSSCTDKAFEVVNELEEYKTDIYVEKPRLVFSSKNDLKTKIEKLKEGYELRDLDVTVLNHGGVLTRNVADFQSLYEAQKELTLSRLTPLQLDSIYNDEDELEFCLSDSIIADMEFAQMLNESREIQVADTVYKYLGSGVAFTHENYVAELSDIDDDIAYTAALGRNPETTLHITPNVDLFIYPYSDIAVSDKEEVDSSSNNSSNTSTSSADSTDGLVLSDGIVIPKSNVRDVDYNSKGDGSWFNRTWNGIWGKKVLAINNFSNKRRLRLSLNDQNYIIYAKIATEVKMQKKVCGIWWNKKAEEIRLGWSAVELKQTFKKPITPLFPKNPYTNKKEYPHYIQYKFQFFNKDAYLLKIPFTDEYIKGKDLNKLLNAGIKAALSAGPNALRSFINSKPKELVGGYSIEPNDYVLYTAVGQNEIVKYNAKTCEEKFYADWFPGEYVLGFTSNNGKISYNISIDKGDNIELSRATVYAAVKYDGKWLAARITK